MYIIHIVEQWESMDNQVVKIHGEDFLDCVLKYLEHNRMFQPQVERQSDGTLIWNDEDFKCVMKSMNKHIWLAYWLLV